MSRYLSVFVGLLIALVGLQNCQPINGQVEQEGNKHEFAIPDANSKEIDALVFEQTLQDAEKGDADAQYLLAVWFMDGKSGERDPQKAAQWMRKAASQGHAGSQFYMGHYYLNGMEVIKKDEQQAFEWFRKAAEQGEPTSQMNLAQCYQKGVGVKEDQVKAFQWFRLSLIHI